MLTEFSHKDRIKKISKLKFKRCGVWFEKKEGGVWGRNRKNRKGIRMTGWAG